MPEVIEEIVVVAPAPRPTATRPFFMRPAPTPPPDPTGPFLPPVIIVPTNPFDQDDDNQIDCWSLLTGDASAVISSGEGYRNHPITGDWRYHNGIDIAVASGTIVRAAQQGTIVQVVNSYRVGTGADGGNLVRINYTDGTQGVYLHLLRTAVSVGASVSPGDIVGTADDTGNSTGPHLHYSIWKKHNHINLSALDPANFYDPEERYGSSCS
ncbi:MAG: M23 family metallopeptidase [Gammaproteobacteria bacterium]|nr:M23 family metallopeptidase [Gammaproteobacteria bacterium]